MVMELFEQVEEPLVLVKEKLELVRIFNAALFFN